MQFGAKSFCQIMLSILLSACHGLFVSVKLQVIVCNCKRPVITEIILPLYKYIHFSICYTLQYYIYSHSEVLFNALLAYASETNEAIAMSLVSIPLSAFRRSTLTFTADNP